MGGKTTTTSTTTIPPPTKEETALTAKQTELADAQLKALSSAGTFTDAYYKAATPLISTTAELYQKELDNLNSSDYQARQDKYNAYLDAQLASATKNQPLYDELLQLQVDQIKNGYAATPAQEKLINEATDAALKSGTSDIGKAETDALRALRLELAPSLGLRPSDSAVLDRGGRVAEEAVRQTGKLTSDLAATNAMAKLNYPLAADKLTSDTTLASSRLLGATEEFQSGLASAASANRLALLGSGSGYTYQAGNLGLGLATGSYGTSALSSALSGYQKDRYASATTTGTTTKGFGFGDILGGAGGLFQGLGAIGLGF